MLELGVKFLISYFIGSLMGAMIVGRIAGGVDIRTMGSGNAGGTNALRTQGLAFAIGVVIIDIGKGFIGAGIVPGLELPFIAEDPEISRTWLTLCCGTAAVFGHVWPVFHRFRGGKGAATLIGALLAIDPTVILPMLAVWVVVLVLSGYVGLATMCAALMLPLWIFVTTMWDGPMTPAELAYFIFGCVMAFFISYWHRSNIQRMRAGEEHRNDKFMIFRRRGAD
ncbi:MAG: glycerol-3-phosphate 1-O-acyltransferase PlsY [Pseudomonadota bacterium]